MTPFLHTIGALFAYKRPAVVAQHSVTHARRPADHGHIIVAGRSALIRTGGEAHITANLSIAWPARGKQQGRGKEN